MRPPSDRSWAAEMRPSREPATRSARGAVHVRGRPAGYAAEVVVGDLRPDRPVEFVVGVAEQDQRFARFGAEAGGVRRRTSSITPSTPMTGVGRIGWIRSGCRS